MEFSITSKLDKTEYIKTMFIGLYKRPYYVLVTIFGLFILAVSMLNYTKLTSFQVYSPITDAIIGLFLLLLPPLIVLMAVRHVKSNSVLLSEITYKFTDVGVSATGSTFKMDFLWEHMIKQNERGKFIILYHTKSAGTFIDKTNLTPEQLLFIKSKIVKK